MSKADIYEKSDIVIIKAEDSLEKCKEWIQKNNLAVSLSDEFANLDTSDDASSEYSICTEDKGETSISIPMCKNSGPNVYKNVLINNSKRIHLGNVTHIKGPVFIGYPPDEPQRTPPNIQIPTKIRMVDRRYWMAQPPVDECDPLETPVKFVIISHTATEDSTVHTENVLIVRLIQQFHIESKKWSDISYNFLIGNEGYTYNGRGWDVIGATSHVYNAFSIGIGFIGCYDRKLPSKVALNQAKALIDFGVKNGKIATDYSLLGARQVSSTCSPGSMLFEEIKTWPHFDESISVTNPHFMVSL